MPKHLFIIHDSGEYKKITGTTIREDTFTVDPNLFYETESEDLFKTVTDLLKDTEVKYPSKYVGKLKLENLVQEKYNPLQLEKMNAIHRGTLLITQRINVFSLLGFAKFIILNNNLADAGYFITDTNREEKYLDIINTNDQKLITQLEEYLEIKDTISQDLHWYDLYMKFKKDVENCKDLDQLKSIFENFSLLFS